MIDPAPPLPQGNSPFKTWARWVHRSVERLRTSDVSGMLVQQTTRGVSVIARRRPGFAALGLSRFLVKSVEEDHLVCHSWDGTTEGTEDVLVAKAPHLRHAITSQVIAGVTVTYSDYAIDGTDYTCTRTASATSYVDQDEMVLPTWQIGEGVDSEIYAFKPSGGTGVEIEIESVMTPLVWLDANIDARAWCQIG